IQKVAPLGMLRPVMAKLTAVRFAAALPFFAPTAVGMSGLLKSSASTGVHVPVVRLVALVLYSKSRRSRTADAAPRRHSSPMNEIASVSIVPPVVLEKGAPIVDENVPTLRVPKARSVAPVEP